MHVCEYIGIYQLPDSLYMHTYTHTHTHTCKYSCIKVQYIFIHTHTYIYIYIYICMYVYTYVCISYLTRCTCGRVQLSDLQMYVYINVRYLYYNLTPIHTCMYTCIHAYIIVQVSDMQMHVHESVCICKPVHPCMHTNTHTLRVYTHIQYKSRLLRAQLC